MSAVAARYARWYLDARPWRLAAGLVLADLFLASVVVGWLSAGPVPGGPGTGEKAAIWLAAGLIAFIIIAPYAVRQIRIIRLCRIELASKLTPQSAAAAGRAGVQPPVAGWTPAAGQQLSVRYDRRRVLLLSSLACVMACFMLVTVIRQWLSGSGVTPYGALCGFFAVPGLFSAVFCARLLVRWVLPGHLVVELDAAGVHLPGIAFDLPWTSLAEVRLIPVRYARRGNQGAVVVAFIPQAPSAVLDAIPAGSRRRKRLERSLRVYGTPLTVSDYIIDHTGEQIAAAAASLATVPVRRVQSGPGQAGIEAPRAAGRPTAP